VGDLWANTHAGERMASGPRLFSLEDTPWRWCAPPDLHAARCLLLTDEVHSFPISGISAAHSVRFANFAAVGVDVHAVVADIAAEEGALLCHCRATPAGGVDNVSA
jgi:hypothetical protein